MKRILAQAIKEWNQFRRDRLTLALSLLLPVIMMLLFGFALALRPTNIQLVIEDLDNTPLSRRYVETYMAANTFVLVPRQPETRLEDELHDGRARIGLRIPVHFESDVLRGAAAHVQVFIDGTDSNTANGLQKRAHALNQAFLLATRARAAQGLTAPPVPVRLNIRYWYNPGLSDRRYFGSGALGLVLILFPSLLGALSASREHEQGTVIQVYASNLTAPQWIVGKALPYIGIGLVELVMCFAIGVALFSYQMPTDPLPFLAASVLYITAAVLYGMAVGNVMGTQSAAIQAVQMGAFLVSMLLSGFLVPVRNIPIELRWISSIIPATYYVEATRDALLRNSGWATMARPVAVLGVMAIVFLAVNYRTMRRMQFTD